MIASLPQEKRRELLASLSDKEAEALLYDWDFWARPSQQIPDGDWLGWLMLCGRGFGKTKTGAETTRRYVELGTYERIALIAPTAADARDVMIEGESGILSVSPPWFRPDYEPSKRRLTWPNGAIATAFSADEPDRLRGPQHDFIWADEPRSWRYPGAWDMAMFGLRLGRNPRWIATTTPNRTALIRKMLATPKLHLSRGSTYENRDNLAEAFFSNIAAQYEGTSLGRQELYADLLEDVEGSLWKQAMFAGEGFRPAVAPQMKRIVVAIDPAITSTESSNETGIVVAGLGMDDHGYVLEDKTLRASPRGWASQAITAYEAWGADRIVVEANQGGEMVTGTLTAIDDRLSIRAVHASRGKLTRAEPVVALYEKGQVHHVGAFEQLEDQMTSYVPGEPSPDRMDALVWALTDLMLSPRRSVEAIPNPFYQG